ncbi:hypothetical protein GN244_ATG09795 [Phytophthora infestans]|uniref:Uncharacterized protein n=1 Tax=Phytophthora infestans TaxID=4787 RepID=A0A833TBA1_PHYIN|nr:hypothetical protein GN244_ATG09795 [Phytophthora infestans]KAF4140718.1 hypothetical protein GN958_ATG10081 [Phytophthora infestans]
MRSFPLLTFRAEAPLTAMARTMQVDEMSGGGKRPGQQQMKVSARTSAEQQVQVRPRTPPKVQQMQVSSTTPPEEQAEVETWPVAYFSDRKDTAKGAKYQEPKELLKEDGIDYAMLMVDAWVLAGRPDNFLQWARRIVPTLIGSDASGACLLNALQQAVQLLGEPSAMTPKMELIFSRRPLEGVQRRRDIAGIKRLKFEDGLYSVAASNTMGVGHALVLEAVTRSLEQCGERINSLMFVRKGTPHYPVTH